jgi:hypothetical protein
LGGARKEMKKEGNMQTNPGDILAIKKALTFL